MAKVSEKSLEQIRQEIDAGIASMTDALRNKDMDALTAAETALKESEREYAQNMEWQVYSEIKKAENPLVEAARRRVFGVLGHKPIKVEGIEVGYEVSAKEKKIDLLSLCKFCELDTTWGYKVEKFNQLLTLRAAKELGFTEAQLKTITKTFYMKELAKQENLGGTPTSNSQIVKQLQTIIDSFMMVPGENGQNIYKANSHDAAYLLMCYTRQDRKALTVQVSKNRAVFGLILDIIHRIVTGKSYDLSYQQVKVKEEKSEDKIVKPKATPKKAKVEAPKAETKKRGRKAKVSNPAEMEVPAPEAVA